MKIAFVYIGDKRIYSDINHHKNFYNFLKDNNIDFKIYEFFGKCKMWRNDKKSNGLNQVSNYYIHENKIKKKLIIKMRIDLWICKSAYKILLDNINYLINGERKFIAFGPPPPHSSMAKQLGGHRKNFFYEENFKISTKFMDPNWGKKYDHNYEILIDSQKPFNMKKYPTFSINDYIIMFDKSIIYGKKYIMKYFKKLSTGKDIPTKWFFSITGEKIRRYGGGNLIWHSICKENIVHYDVYCNLSITRIKSNSDGSGMYGMIDPSRLNTIIPNLNITYKEYFKEYFKAHENNLEL